MLEAAVGAVLSSARGWLTPPVLFVFVNLVIGTIAVMSRLMSSTTTGPGDGTQQRSLMRAPSVAFDRLRCFSFSRLGVPAVDPAFGDVAAEDVAPDGGGEWRRASLLRAPSVALDRLRGFSFNRRGPAVGDPPVAPSDDGATDAEPSATLRPAEAGTMEREREHEHAGIERSQSEAAAEAPASRRRGPRARRTRNKSGSEERPGTTAEATAGAGEAGAGRHELPPPVEVDARADDFIRQFREQLRLQRLDSILRYRDTLRRTGTV